MEDLGLKTDTVFGKQKMFQCMTVRVQPQMRLKMNQNTIELRKTANALLVN
jgi:hypothetical protein